MTAAMHLALIDLERKVNGRRLSSEQIGLVDLQFVLCEDYKTVMIYAHLNESEAEVTTFMIANGAAFDPSAYEQMVAAQSLTVH